MQQHSPADHTERARPLLGTRVAIRINQMAPQQAHELIDEAFARIAEIHQLMSFHEAGSDLYRLNHEATQRPVQVAEKTWQVLSAAQGLSSASDGVFDVTVASALVAAGALPWHAEMPVPGGGADWRDVELLPERHVRFHQALWLDLGGIAKGYAVDCAVDFLCGAGVAHGCVNAGGDLRVFGPAVERVYLLSAASASEMPVLEISDAAVASSGGDGMHFNGVTHANVDQRLRASVVAPDCMTADALTKIVLADSRLAASLLPQYRAVAYLFDPRDSTHGGWRTLGAPDESAW